MLIGLAGVIAGVAAMIVPARGRANFDCFWITYRRRRRACPGDREFKAQRKNNRGGRDKPGHDPAERQVLKT